MANIVYNVGKQAFAQGRVTTAATYTVVLVSTGYTADQDHTLLDDGTTSDPRSYETTGSTGYGRTNLASVSLVVDNTQEFAYLDAADTTFVTCTTGATAGGAVIYIYSSSGGTTSDTGQTLLSYYGFSSPVTYNGGNVTVQWASSSQGGFLKLGTTS